MTIPPKSEAAKFRKAAELIANETCGYCCTALFVVRATTNSRLIFEGFFKPFPRLILWWNWGEREARILALLIAAQIIEEGGAL